MKVRAIEFIGDNRSRLATREEVHEKTDRTVSGRTLVSLISPGTEVGMRRRNGADPFTPGYACAFEVDEVGAAVTRIRPGDIVLAMGPHADRQHLDEEDVFSLPDGLSPDRAVFARMMAVSWATLMSTAARPADRVLIAGSGVVGNLAAQIFHSGGYRVTAIDPHEGRRMLLEQSGVATVASVEPSADREGFALSIDCSGNDRSVFDIARATRHGGEVVLVGSPWLRRSDTTAHALIEIVYRRFLQLRSGWEWRLPRRWQIGIQGNTTDAIEGSLLWLSQGRVQTEALARTIAPAEVPDIYDAFESATFSHLTALIDWTR